MKHKLLPLLLAAGFSYPLSVFATCEPFVPVVLAEGVPMENLSTDNNEAIYFVIDAPAGGQDLRVTTSGGVGDVDLYVRHGGLPNRGNADGESPYPDNEEEVIIVDPIPGKYYILLHPYSAFSGVTLTASYTSPVPIAALATGSSLTNLSANTGEELYFTVEADGNSDILVTTSGGSGDVDLYARLGKLVAPGYEDYGSAEPLTEEEIRIRFPQPGTYYLSLVAETAFSGVTLSASSLPLTQVNTLTDGSTINGLSADTDASIYYVIDSPGDGRDIRITTAGTSGDLDLFVREGNLPNILNFDYSSEESFSNEEVYIKSPPQGTQYFIELYGFDAFSDVTLSASYVPGATIPDLNIGQVRENLGADLGDSLYFKVDVPPGQCAFTVTTSGGSGDLDLVVMKDRIPAGLHFLEFSDNDFNVESVTIPNPEPGTYYIQVFAFDPFSGATLTTSITAGPDVSPWSEAETFSNGWSRLPWFGYFTQELDPWIFHLEHGFLYYSASGPESIYLYDIGMQAWFWTSSSVYPAIYILDATPGWYWYLEGGRVGNRRFVRLADGVTVHEMDW